MDSLRAREWWQQVTQIRAEDPGLTDEQIASRLGVSRRTFYRRRDQAQIPKRVMDHSSAIPWTVPKADVDHTYCTYLRALSYIAQGVPGGSPRQRSAALRWAREGVADHLDVIYDSLGWRMVPAVESQWHLKAVLAAALSTLEGSK
ncbi:Predicted DNA-binding transcriptional regulator AlpA [Sinosporangium album]|uniref:Predicted DNA-binding transcriptional regulator AlpA n=1 Tax=Sinosporangium album TaxID=504805 RepID=A0A1G8A9U5_9ACTN|nr:Predicted DNA-binding transcriptional regulator AlpA [Sinosporangium album]